jgi:uncharacterized membrane protein YhaH (DUF805 family)
MIAAARKDQGARMDWMTLLFSFKGRINRGKYWLAVLIYMAVWTTFIAISLIWLGGLDIDNLLRFAGAALLIWLIGFILLVVGTWSGLAVGVKRLHDRDKSGWWILLLWLGPGFLGGSQAVTPDLGGGFIFSLAATAIAIWAFVELGCLPGTAGPNRYGPDPLGANPAFAPRR